MSFVLWALNQGEGQQIEFKSTIPSILDLGRLISGFANASGGWIIVGIDDRPPPVILGCDWQQLSNLFDRVNQRITPPQSVTLHRVDMAQSRPVGVIVVKPSSQLVVTDAGAFKRAGERTLPFNEKEIKDVSRPTPAPQPDYLQAIARMSGSIEELLEAQHTTKEEVAQLRGELQYAQSWKGQLPAWAVGFGLGIIASYTANHFVLLPWLDMHKQPDN